MNVYFDTRAINTILELVKFYNDSEFFLSEQKKLIKYLNFSKCDC